VTWKQKIYAHYKATLDNKIRDLQAVMSGLKESSGNETKRTAGDKHETALAMLQIEQANVGYQLNDLLAKRAVIEKINPSLCTSHIINGSLVKTDHGYFFIIIAAGKEYIDGIAITALSSQSPLGAKLMGLSAGARVEMAGKHYYIQTVA